MKCYAIALENLDSLRESVDSKGDEVVWKFTMFAYRRLQYSVISKAIEYGVPIVIINPRNASSTCPGCGEKLISIRLAICRLCGFKIDRDSIGAMNIRLKAFEAYVEGAWVISKNLRNEG